MVPHLNPPTRTSTLPALGRRKLPVPTTRSSSTQASRPASRATRRDEVSGLTHSNSAVVSQSSGPLGAAALATSDAPSIPLPDFSTSITVAVRCRGRNERETQESSAVILETDGMRGKTVDLILSRGHSASNYPASASGNAANANNGRKTYMFDTVFSAAADQRSVFESVVAGIVDEVLSGLNCTIFAYGQTGTGKTYTMTGDISSDTPIPAGAGIIPRVFHYLFGKLDGTSEASERRDRTVKCSYLELYNEELRDLFADEVEGEVRSKLKMFDDRSKGRVSTLVQGLEEQYVDSAVAGIELLRAGSERRETAATGCNDRSSRSHSIFTITILQSGDGDDQISVGKLNLVDLAGSENIQRSGAENKRATEAGLINRSLLALGRVINSLVDGTGHIPYRESKLTRLLQDSLGGHTKTCMIATVSPAQSNIEETISTLDYAFRAKNIRNAPQFNAALSKRTLLRDFAAEISRLKGELSATRQRNGVYLTAAGYDQLLAESESRRIEAAERAERVTALEGHVATKEQEVANLQAVIGEMKGRVAETERRLGKAEENARREAEAAAEALAAAVANIDSLDGSLRRRAGVEAKNRARWQKMRRAVVVGVSRIEEMVAKAKKGHTLAVQNFGEQLGGLVERTLWERTVQNVTAEFKDKIKDAMGEVEMCITHKPNAKVLQDFESAVAKVHDVEIDSVVQVAQTGASQVTELVQELEREIHAAFDGLVPHLSEAFSEIETWADAQCQDAVKMEEALELLKLNLRANTTSTRDRIQEAIAGERARAAAEKQALVKRVAELVEQSGHESDQQLSRIGALADNAVGGWQSAMEGQCNSDLLTLAKNTSLRSHDLLEMQNRIAKSVNAAIGAGGADATSCASRHRQALTTAHSNTLSAITLLRARLGAELADFKETFKLNVARLEAHEDTELEAWEALDKIHKEGIENLYKAYEKEGKALLDIQSTSTAALETIGLWGESLVEVADGVGALVQAIDTNEGNSSSNINGQGLDGGVAGNEVGDRSDIGGWEEYIPSGKTPIKQGGYSGVDEDESGSGEDVSAGEGTGHNTIASHTGPGERGRTGAKIESAEFGLIRSVRRGLPTSIPPLTRSRSTSQQGGTTGAKTDFSLQNGAGGSDSTFAQASPLRAEVWRDRVSAPSTTMTVPTKGANESSGSSGSSTPYPNPQQLQGFVSANGSGLSSTGGVTASRRTPSLGGLLKELEMNSFVMDMNVSSGSTGSGQSSGVLGGESANSRLSGTAAASAAAPSRTSNSSIADRKGAVRTRSEFPPVQAPATARSSRPAMHSSNTSSSIMSGVSNLRRKRVASTVLGPATGNAGSAGYANVALGTSGDFASGAAGFEAKIKRRKVVTSVSTTGSGLGPVTETGGASGVATTTTTRSGTVTSASATRSGGAGGGNVHTKDRAEQARERGRENVPVPMRAVR